MKLIVGLGNPGKEYTKTRHNLGFQALDYLAEKLDFSFNEKKFNGIYSTIFLNNQKIIFLKPQSYVNLSGEVIKRFIDYFKINIEDVLIIYDDMDLEVGKFKLKAMGGSAGHNGLKSIEDKLQTNEYKRLKIGIAKNKGIDIVNYVLGYFSKKENSLIKSVMELLPNIINDYLIDSFEKLMSKYN